MSSRIRFLFIGALLFGSTSVCAEDSWREFAEREYGAEKGAKIYELLKPLCEACETLVAHPGISAHYEEILKKTADTPAQRFTSPRACLDWFNSVLGSTHVYRGLALTRVEYEKIIAEGSMAATGSAVLPPQFSKKRAVLQHLLKMPGEATPILSVTSYPDLATAVSKGYAEHAASFNEDLTFKPGTKVYLFEFDLPRLEVWGYTDAFGPLPKELTPNGTTMILENNGMKHREMQTIREPNGVTSTISWDVYADSRIIRESAYDAKLESFVYGDIPVRYLNSVTAFSEKDLSKYSWVAVPAEERTKMIADFRLTADSNAENRFSKFLASRRPIFNRSMYCKSLLTSRHSNP